MEGRGTTADPASAMRVVHAAIMGGVVIVYAALAFLGGTVTAPDETVRHVLRITGYASIAIAYVAGKALRDRIAATDHTQPADRWWSAHRGKAVALWAVLEGGGMVPIVIGFLTADRLLAGLGAAASLVLLFVTRPSVLASPRD